MSILSRVARRLEAFPDTPAWFDKHLATPALQWLVLVALGLALRIATFGDPNLHVDEAWYFLVGQEMHHGAIPYVTIWDRKPVGLFLLYYLFAGISTNVLAYQIPAWLFASTTAWVIARIAARWTGAQGAVLAGASYLFMLGPLEGFGGQTPVFYNLLIAAAAWLVLQSLDALDAGRPGWRMLAAMALAGMALTLKQTTMFEAAFFGLFAAYRLWRSSAPRLRAAGWIAVWIVIGAGPTLATAAWYFQHGFWPEFWQAMVLSNLAKTKPEIGELAENALRVALVTYPLWGLSALTYFLRRQDNRQDASDGFFGLWAMACVLAILIVPNFYAHYALPALVPGLAYISYSLGKREIGVFLAAAICLFCVVLYNPANFADRHSSRIAMMRMADAIAVHRTRGGLLVFDGPAYLYSLSDERTPKGLAFPNHFNQWAERNVSQFDTYTETEKIIRANPEAVVLSAFPSIYPANGDTRSIVTQYVYNQCELIDVDLSYDVYSTTLVGIWGRCRQQRPAN